MKVLFLILFFLKTAHAKLECKLLTERETEFVEFKDLELGIYVKLELFPTSPDLSSAFDFGDFKLKVARGVIHVFQHQREVCTLHPRSFQAN